MSKSGGARRIVEYLGSAHDETDVAALLEVGRQKIASRQGQGLLDLGVLPREVVNAAGGICAVSSLLRHSLGREPGAGWWSRRRGGRRDGA